MFSYTLVIIDTGGNMGIKIIRNKKLWMEEETIQHLEKIAEFDGVEEVVGLPDLHESKVPVGMTVKSKDIIYPFLIGNDIGCGMSLFDTNIKLKKFNVDSYVKKLTNTRIIGKYSIGGGNHFAEYQKIEKIFNKEEAEKIKLNKNHLFVLVHSGSRKLGDDIYREYASLEGLTEGSNRFKRYLVLHQKAIEVAKENRIGIANALMDKIKVKYDNQLIIDCMHNNLAFYDGYFYHHKGSISSRSEYAIIAGSRGSYSYVVKCIPTEATLFSISHGSGRKWARNFCKGRLETKYKKDELKTTKLKSQVICDNQLLYEEATEAYKNIEDVIDTLLEYKAIELIARLKPLVTYKC